MASSQKKVVVRRFSGEILAGYLPSSDFVVDGSVALLDLSGRLHPIALSEIKFIGFVRDFNLNDAAAMERELRRTYLARPRTEGLWVRITFRSADLVEGLITAGLDLLDEVASLRGLQLTLPDARSNMQRMYIPRSAMSRLELMGVISAARRGPRAPEKAKQNELFDQLEPD